MKLLLIEDDNALHTALSRSLARLGWQVDVCADGRTALPRWRAGHPDVVLLDLTLPGRDGLAVLQQARDEGFTTPVLILTARGTVGLFVHHSDTQILNIKELSSVIHFPNSKFNRNPRLRRQNFKIVPAPDNIPTEGILL